MIQFHGLHGVPLAAPASARLALEIGLTPRGRPAGPEVPVQPEGRPLSRRTLRVLHALVRLQRFNRVEAVQLCAGLHDEPAQTVRDDLNRLHRHGYAMKHRQPGRPALWQATREGSARAMRDAQSVTLGDVLDAVRAINADPVDGRGRWWPLLGAGSDRQPATAGAVARFLTSGAKIAGLEGLVAGALDTLAQREVLTVATWQRSTGRDQLLFWSVGATHA